MSDLAPTAAPPHHLKVWSDGTRVYCEIPGIQGKPAYVTAYNYDSRGVDLVLSLLGIHRCNYDYQGTIPTGYTGKPAVTPQQAQAEAICRRLGIIK